MTSVGKYSNKFVSDVENIKKVLKEIQNFIDSNFPHMCDEMRYETRLIFSELLCNAVIHGNKFDKEKIVYISIKAFKDSIEAVIKDEGDGFNYDSFTTSMQEGFSIRENGRGIFLVYNLTDTMTFNIEGNEINFIKKVI